LSNFQQRFFMKSWHFKHVCQGFLGPLWLCPSLRRDACG
jgi:hypothetical protein